MSELARSEREGQKHESFVFARLLAMGLARARFSPPAATEDRREKAH